MLTVASIVLYAASAVVSFFVGFLLSAEGLPTQFFDKVFLFGFVTLAVFLFIAASVIGAA